MNRAPRIVLIKNELYYRWSGPHASAALAHDAIYSDFAAGEISPSDKPTVHKNAVYLLEK